MVVTWTVVVETVKAKEIVTDGTPLVIVPPQNGTKRRIVGVATNMITEAVTAMPHLFHHLHLDLAVNITPRRRNIARKRRARRSTRRRRIESMTANHLERRVRKVDTVVEVVHHPIHHQLQPLQLQPHQEHMN